MTVSMAFCPATMVDLYQIDGKITEPAGTLSIAALEQRGIFRNNGVYLSGTNFDE